MKPKFVDVMMKPKFVDVMRSFVYAVELTQVIEGDLRYLKRVSFNTDVAEGVVDALEELFQELDILDQTLIGA